MVTNEQIARINALAEKKKTAAGLTAEELAEQQNLRQIYLESVRGNLRAQLEGVKKAEEEKSDLEPGVS